MKLVLLALLASAFGCANVRNATLADTLYTFVSEGRARGVVVHPEAVDIRFVDSLPGDVAGRCFYNQSPRVVEISRAVWDSGFYTDDTRRQIVFHELGHCLLGIHGHTVNLEPFPAKHSVGIMESELIPYERYAGHEAEWLDRLFWRRK